MFVGFLLSNDEYNNFYIQVSHTFNTTGHITRFEKKNRKKTRNKIFESGVFELIRVTSSGYFDSLISLKLAVSGKYYVSVSK